MKSSIEIRFVSRNSHKLEEAKAILAPQGVIVSPDLYTIEELQTDDTKRLVKDKASKAFQRLGELLFVEHTGLYLDELNGLPGGLTQIFWDKLEADSRLLWGSIFCAMIRPSSILIRKPK
ncbi:MAG: non-canonical purine NTP pyrophosphatase [Acidobacteriia bacterium]|nr:non-canonical purine NTP pyrophosphatase [Terriglobia bacterium]